MAKNMIKLYQHCQTTKWNRPESSVKNCQCSVLQCVTCVQRNQGATDRQQKINPTKPQVKTCLIVNGESNRNRGCGPPFNRSTTESTAVIEGQIHLLSFFSYIAPCFLKFAKNDLPFLFLLKP